MSSSKLKYLKGMKKKEIDYKREFTSTKSFSSQQTAMNVKQQWIRLSFHLPMKNYRSLEAICCLCFMMKVLTSFTLKSNCPISQSG